MKKQQSNKIDILIEQKLEELNWKKALSTAALGAGLAMTPGNMFDKVTDIKPDQKYVTVSDKRNVANKKLKSGKYERQLIVNIVRKSVERNISPELVLALLAQESTFGKDSKHNPLQIDTRYHPHLSDGHDLDDALDIIEKTILNEKYKKLSPAQRIQLYNGLTKKTKSNPAYGRSVINLAKNTIRKSFDLMDIVKKYKKHKLRGDELIK